MPVVIAGDAFVRRHATRASRRWLRVITLLFALILFLGSDPSCDQPPPENETPPPELTIGLNGISAPFTSVLVVPPSGFVVNVAWAAVDSPVDLATLQVVLASESHTFNITDLITPDASSAVYVVPASLGIVPGTYIAYAAIGDEDGSLAQKGMGFGVRWQADPGDTTALPWQRPPVGTGQTVFFDFESDRDGVIGADFKADLIEFGLAWDGAPKLSKRVRERVISTVLDRVAEVYHDANPSGIPGGDPIDVTFVTQDPGGPDVTRICVGGAAPGNPNMIGSILIDPHNQQRDSEECATLPATGIFPRGLLAYAGASEFQATIDPLRPAVGGVRIGWHSADATVLSNTFDPSTASAEELARMFEIDAAIDAFATALGTITAHETGHALGLVPEGAPAVGLYGGATGADFSHNIDPDGSQPEGLALMDPGYAFTFGKLAGLGGEPLPALRPLNHAYLRDRLVLDGRVTEIILPPTLESVAPTALSGPIQALTILGKGFAPPIQLRLVSPDWTYQAAFADVVTESEISAFVITSQVLTGTYDVVLENGDGQTDVLVGAITVP